MTGRAISDGALRKASRRRYVSHASRDWNKVVKSYRHTYIYTHNFGYACVYNLYTCI